MGFIYIIPFTYLVGNFGYALYKYAYGPYSLMLTPSNIGIPLAIANMVSKNKQKGSEDVIHRILKFGLLLMAISGLISFLILYISAPYLAELLVNNGSRGNSQESVSYVIRIVSISLIIIPTMSFLRGFFQGFQSMGPSAVSIVIEQLTRVCFIVIGVYISLEILSLTLTKAVGIATFGSFVGGMFGSGVLLYYLWKRMKSVLKYKNAKQDSVKIPVFNIYKEIIIYSIPFVITGLTLPIYQNIDTYTINQVLTNNGYNQPDAEIVNSVIGLSQILVLLPISITTGLSVTMVSNLTKTYFQNNEDALRKQIGQSVLILFFIISPTAIGIFVLSDPLYTFLFGTENSPEMGGRLLKVYAPAAILIALYGVTCSILQSINQHKKLIFGMLAGVITKFLLNILLPIIYYDEGFIYATYCGYFISLSFNIFLITKSISLRLTHIRYRLISIFISTSIMMVSVSFLEKYMTQNLISVFWIVSVCTVCGFIIYILFLYLLNYPQYKKCIENGEI